MQSKHGAQIYNIKVIFKKELQLYITIGFTYYFWNLRKKSGLLLGTCWRNTSGTWGTLFTTYWELDGNALRTTKKIQHPQPSPICISSWFANLAWNLHQSLKFVYFWIWVWWLVMDFQSFWKSDSRKRWFENWNKGKWNTLWLLFWGDGNRELWSGTQKNH